MTDLIWSDATAQAGAIRRGEVAAVELVGEYLRRIDSLNPKLRAYVSVDADAALAAARAADERRTQSGGAPPFDGVTLSVKDVEDVAGLPTTQSCELLAGNVASADGPVARRLRSAGFVLLGKTNVPEFCSDMTTSKLNGAALNPWDLERTPGGSSGGAAGALAAGLCAAAHGTDGAGSVRVPASFCGLVGLKPTRGLIAFGPDEGNSFFGCSTAGTLSRSVRDAAALLDVLAPLGGWTPHRAGPFVDEVSRDPGRLRIGVCTTFLVGTVDPECVAAVESAGATLESLGHHVEAVTPQWEVILAATGPLEVPSAAALVSADQADLVEPRNRGMITDLAQRTVLAHHRWVETVREAATAFLAPWDHIVVLVTPTCGVLPPRADWARWDDDSDAHLARFMDFPNFAQPFNVSGQPAVSLPLGWSAAGLPIGVQLAGRKLEEGLLFRLAAQLERQSRWEERTTAAGRALG